MFGLEAPVITVGVILDIVIVKVTVIVCVMRDVAGDNPVEVSDMVIQLFSGCTCICAFSTVMSIQNAMLDPL